MGSLWWKCWQTNTFQIIVTSNTNAKMLAKLELKSCNSVNYAKALNMPKQTLWQSINYTQALIMPMHKICTCINFATV